MFVMITPSTNSSPVEKRETPLCSCPHLCIWEKCNDVSNSIPDYTLRKDYWEKFCFHLILPKYIAISLS